MKRLVLTLVLALTATAFSTATAQTINDGGTVRINSGATVKLGDGQTVEVNAGGRLELNGTPSRRVNLTRANTGDRFSVDVDGTSANRGELSVNFASIEYLDADGFQLHEGVSVEALDNIRWDHVPTSGTYLNLAPTTDPPGSGDSTYFKGVLFGHIFDDSDSASGASNVKAGANTPLTSMRNWAGDLGGEANDDDTSDRVDWEDHTFFGNDLVLSGQGPAGGSVEIDLDGDSTPDYTVDIDSNGNWTISIDATDLSVGANTVDIEILDSGSNTVDSYSLALTRDTSTDLSDTLYVPANNTAQAICHSMSCGAFSGSPACTQLGSDGTNVHEYGVQLPSQQLIRRFHTMEIDGLHGLTTNMDFHFVLEHRSATDFDSTVGQSWTHNWNTYIEEQNDGDVIIFNTRLTGYEATATTTGDGTQGGDYDLKVGYFASLVKDTDESRFELQLMNGVKYVYYAAPVGVPGRLLYVEDPNGNQIRVTYDLSGRISGFVDTIGHVIEVIYDNDGRIEYITDHADRTWTLVYDGNDDLTEIQTPAVDSFEIAVDDEIEETDSSTVSSQVNKFAYNAGHDMTSWKQKYTANTADDEEPEKYEYTGGLLTSLFRNDDGVDADEEIIFDSNPTASPTPLSLLDTGNVRVRMTDREGNICDYEFLPSTDTYAYGVRRQVCWTETGKGNTALRSGEPDYWEQRWVQDCPCLLPGKVSQPWSEDDITGALITFDSDDFPTDYPRTIFEYDNGTATADTVRRLVTEYLYKGFVAAEEVKWTATYATFANFSRRLTWVDPRAFDTTDPIHDQGSLDEDDFETTYTYTSTGDLNVATYPSITEGQTGTQTITTDNDYNNRGQITQVKDGEANLTTFGYFGSGNGIVGYRRLTVRGASGSQDSNVDLTTEVTQASVLGDIEKFKDPNASDGVYDDEYEIDYDVLRRVVERRTPKVDNPSANIAVSEQTYVNQTNWDKAGRAVRLRVKNYNFAGSLDTDNSWIDTVNTFDKVGNLLSTTREADYEGPSSHIEIDLVTSFLYDRNDDRSAVIQPLLNRTLTVYDERRLVLKTFSGCSKLGELGAKTSDTLANGDFISLTKITYDARSNLVARTDGRGNDWDSEFDFRNRNVKSFDPLNNYRLTTYNDADQVLMVESYGLPDSFGDGTDTGEYDDPLTLGTDEELLSRSYSRYDRIGRAYQRVNDIDLTDDESSDFDPTNAENSSFTILFDKSSRAAKLTNANGNSTYSTFDAANRLTLREDAFKDVGSSYVNTVTWTLDANGNALEIQEVERPSTGGTGSTYYTTNKFDEINRNVLTTIEGTSKSSSADGVDDKTERFFDSRGNLAVLIDAEAIDGASGYDNPGGTDVTTFDDADRAMVFERFEGVDTSTDSKRLRLTEAFFDKNSRVELQCAYTDVDKATPSGTQKTLMGYDDLDRLIYTILPDSDETLNYIFSPPAVITGTDSNDHDYIELEYDEDSNNTLREDQRGFVIENTFDPRNLLVNVDVTTIPTGGVGATFERHRYDGLGRLRVSRNNHAKCVSTFDAFSRLTLQTCSIEWAGAATATDDDDYVHPYTKKMVYDKQGNQTELWGNWVSLSEYSIKRVQDHDELERVDIVQARFGDGDSLRTEATYTFIGPNRVNEKKVYALDGSTSITAKWGWDAKRRSDEIRWDEADTTTLVMGNTETFDQMNNPLTRGWLHNIDDITDDPRTDYHFFNARYELVAWTYDYPDESTAPVQASEADYNLVFDDNWNRLSAEFPDGDRRTTLEHPVQVQDYADTAVSDANEYQSFSQDLDDETVSHDAAGNATSIPTGAEGGIGSSAAEILGEYDAWNRLFNADSGDYGAGRKYFQYLFNTAGQRIGSIKYTAAGRTTAFEGVRFHYQPDGRDLEEWNQTFDVDPTAPESPTARRQYIQSPEGIVTFRSDLDEDDTYESGEDFNPLHGLELAYLGSTGRRGSSEEFIGEFANPDFEELAIEEKAYIGVSGGIERDSTAEIAYSRDDDTYIDPGDSDNRYSLSPTGFDFLVGNLRCDQGGMELGSLLSPSGITFNPSMGVPGGRITGCGSNLYSPFLNNGIWFGPDVDQTSGPPPLDQLVRDPEIVRQEEEIYRILYDNEPVYAVNEKYFNRDLLYARSRCTCEEMKKRLKITAGEHDRGALGKLRETTLKRDETMVREEQSPDRYEMTKGRSTSKHSYEFKSESKYMKPDRDGNLLIQAGFNKGTLKFCSGRSALRMYSSAGQSQYTNRVGTDTFQAWDGLVQIRGGTISARDRYIGLPHQTTVTIDLYVYPFTYRGKGENAKPETFCARYEIKILDKDK